MSEFFKSVVCLLLNNILILTLNIINLYANFLLPDIILHISVIHSLSLCNGITSQLF